MKRRGIVRVEVRVRKEDAPLVRARGAGRSTIRRVQQRRGRSFGSIFAGEAREASRRCSRRRRSRASISNERGTEPSGKIAAIV